MASVHSMMGAEPRRHLLTQSIKELAGAPCSKSDLIGCMEEFVKQRRESLAPQAGATFGSTAPRAARGSTIGRAVEETSLPQPLPQPKPRAASGLTKTRRKRCDSQGSGSGGDLSSSGEGHDELKAPSPTLPSRRAVRPPPSLTPFFFRLRAALTVGEWWCAESEQQARTEPGDDLAQQRATYPSRDIAA